jgi:hypothetical protein
VVEVRTLIQRARTATASTLRGLGWLDPLKGIITGVQEKTGVFGPRLMIPWPTVEQQMRGVVSRSGDLDVLIRQAGERRVLFVAPRGLHYDLVLQAALAHRLLFDGVESRFFVCQNLPLCNVRDLQTEAEVVPCAGCMGRNLEFLDIARIGYATLDELVPGGERERQQEMVGGLTLDQCRELWVDGFPLGRIVFPSVARYLLREDLAGEQPEVATRVYRQFLFGAALILQAIQAMVDDFEPESMVFVNGKLLWSAVAQAVCEQRRIRPVSYEDIGSRFVGRTWVFNSPKSVMDLDFDGPWQAYLDTPLGPDEDAALDESLASRRRPGLFYRRMESEQRQIADELGISRDDRPIVLFSNVTWDTAALEKNTAFEGVKDWVVRTVTHYAGHNRPVVIRTHPAEQKAFDGAMSRELIEDAIRREYPVLPDNIRIISSSSPISSYTLLEMSGFAVVYTSTLGLETALLGRPTIVAGQAHYAGKGFTYDANTAEHYFDLIDRSDELAVDEQQIERARRYAYLFFFQLPHTIDLWQAFEPHSVDRLKIRRLDDLKPGRIAELDRVAAGILGEGLFCRPRP